MADRPAGTGQWRKLFFSKYHSDTQGVVWKLSTWKILFWMLLVTILLIIAFSFFSDNQGDFLKEILFYGIVIMIIIMIVWIAANFIWKAREIFVRFMLAWILILGTYWLLGVIVQATGLFLNGFHYGFSTWILISVLAIKAKSIDKNIDRNDVFYALLVIVVIFIANAPIFAENMGFLAQLDSFIGLISERLSFINPQDLYVK